MSYASTGTALSEGFQVPREALRVIGPWIRAKAEKNTSRVALEINGRPKSYESVHVDSDRFAIESIPGSGLEEARQKHERFPHLLKGSHEFDCC